MIKHLVDQTVAADLLHDFFKLSTQDYISTSSATIKHQNLNDSVKILRHLSKRKAVRLLEDLAKRKKISFMQFLQLQNVVIDRSVNYVYMEFNNN